MFGLKKSMNIKAVVYCSTKTDNLNLKKRDNKNIIETGVFLVNVISLIECVQTFKLTFIIFLFSWVCFFLSFLLFLSFFFFFVILNLISR